MSGETKKTQRIVAPEISAARAKAREDESCDETFNNKLGAVYAAAKALRDVPNARVQLHGLTEGEVAAFADAFEVKVSRQVAVLGMGLSENRPVVIYSFDAVYEAVLTGGKFDVAIGGQGSRRATAAEARRYGVSLAEKSETVTGDAAARLVEAA